MSRIVHYNLGGSRSPTTDDPAEVTCPTCITLIHMGAESLAARAGRPTSMVNAYAILTDAERRLLRRWKLPGASD